MGPMNYPNYPQQQVNQMRPALQNSQGPVTNKILVTCKEEALSRPCDLNSIMLYIDQTTGDLYEVYTDYMGMKNLREYSTKLKEPQKEQSELTSKLEEKIKELEDKVNSLFATKEEAKNE